MSEAQLTKKALAEALMALCREKPYEKISVQELTKHAQLNRQTFYYHFPDKQALLQWTYENQALHFLADEVTTIDNWEEQALKMLKAITAEEAFYTSSVKADQQVLATTFSEMIQGLFIRLFEQMDIEKQLLAEDKEFYARFFSYGCSGVLLNWIVKGYQEPPLIIATQLFRLAKDIEFFAYRLYTEQEE
ncbi:TetR/AcrR family transcriptional regulator [Enterococcus canis]|uniref:TetR/AcrR family transcriptional regulator n=1 Tax=Enterococcus canis TaxID=214095 RepID=UPI00082E443A|nr:TetR/AcrR family transcriptional regulator [Enterococcus canis]